MSLTLAEIRKIVKPRHNGPGMSSIEIIDSWAEYESGPSAGERPLEYLCYEIESIDPETGEHRHYYKALKFVRIIRLPKGAKQSTALMDMHTQVLAALYEQNYNFVTVIANVREPVALGLLFLYGVQGVAENIADARKIAHDAFMGMTAVMQGTYRVLEMRIVNAQEIEWLRDKLYRMDFTTVIRGIPKASKTGEDAGNKGMGGKNINPDSEGTLEEIITGMADYEYVIEILTTPVYQSTLRDWAAATRRDMSDWQEQLQGTKGFSMNLSIPMMYAANQGASRGMNKGYTSAESVNYSQGTSLNTSYGENVGQALSRSYGQSFGKSYGQSFSESISQTHTVSQGVTQGHTVGMSIGTSRGTSVGQNTGTSQSQSIGSSASQSSGQSFGESAGISTNRSAGQSTGLSQGSSFNQSFGQNASRSSGLSMGENTGSSFGQNVSRSEGSNVSQSFGQSTSQGRSSGISETSGQSVGQSFGASKNIGSSVGTSQNVSHGTSENASYGQSFGSSIGRSSGQSFSASQGQSSSMGHSLGNSSSESVSHSESTSRSIGETSGVSHSYGQSASSGWSESESAGQNHSVSANKSWGYNESTGSSTSSSTGANSSDTTGSNTGGGLSLLGVNFNTSGNQSQSNGSNWSAGTGSSASVGYSESGSVGENSGSSYSYSQGNSGSVGTSESIGSSASRSATEGYSKGTSYGQSEGVSESFSTSFGKTMSESYGVNQSTSSSQSVSNSESIGHGTSFSEGYGSSQSMSMSQGSSYGQNAGQSYSHGVNQGYSESVGQNYGLSQGQSASFSQGESVSQSYGQSMSRSQSDSYGESMSTGYGNSISQSVGQSFSEGQGSSYSQNAGQSVSQSTGTSIGQSLGVSKGYSVSASNGISQSRSESQSYSVSQSESWSTSHGYTKGESYTESESESVSSGQTDSYGQSKSIGQGQSTSRGYGSSQSETQGYSTGLTSGASSSMGISPSIGYSKTYQWLDQEVKDLVEMLNYQNERLKNALRGNGAFYSYVYIACPSEDALSSAKALAKSTWQNDEAMINPLQVLNLNKGEQQNILTHCMGFSADVSMEYVGKVKEYKYCSILLPKELVSYTHLPRISEGGLFVEVGDVPKFSVPSMLKGEVYMGSVLSAERYTMRGGYTTPFQYRIDERELMHMFVTGASRSGKTVAAMRFVAELTRVRRKSTGKRLRIVCMDPKQDWRSLAKYVEPERFRFYNMGNTLFRPIHLNPLKIPHGVNPQFWIDGVIDIYCRAYGLLERGKQMLGETIYQLYSEAGVFGLTEDMRQERILRYRKEYMTDNAISLNDNAGIADALKYASDRVDQENEDIKKNRCPDKISEMSSHVTFAKVYDRMNLIKLAMEGDKESEEELFRLTKQRSKGRSGNDTKDAYARLLDRLQAFNREFSVERQLFGTEDGISVDELIGGDDITVLESKGLENTFRNFIFGVITSGFYKFALAHEGGFLAEDQYETMLVIEEANEVLTGSDVAGTGSGQSFGMTGQSEFEQILDQSAGYGLFIMAITQKISDMPKSIIANSGLVFAGRLKTPDDITTVVRAIAREDKFEDRDLVKWFPRSPTGWFVCMSSRTYDFKDSEPILVKISPLNLRAPTNAEIDELMAVRSIKQITPPGAEL